MNENIFWVVAAKVKDGQLENLKTLKKEMIESIEANEPGALNYEWFISSDEKYCHIFECYTDSVATINHLKIFVKDYVKRFLSVLEVKNYTVYGEPSEELIKMFTPMGVVFMKPFGGFKK